MKQRTALKNRVHALLAKEGLTSPFADLFSRSGRKWLSEAPLALEKRQRLESFLRVLDCLCQEISEAETSIRRSVADDSRARLLTTIPGIGFQIALIVLAEIGDVGRFPDANHLVSYAGLAPRVRSSGGKTKLGSITKQGVERPPLGVS